MQNGRLSSYGPFGAALVRRGRTDQALDLARNLPAAWRTSLGPIIKATIAGQQIDTTVQLLELVSGHLDGLAATAWEVVSLYPEQAKGIAVLFGLYLPQVDA
jgi:hypothetical protein